MRTSGSGGGIGPGVGTFVFFWLAPATVSGLIPWLLTHWSMRPPLLGLPAARLAGFLLVAAGAACIVECFVRFAVKGRGTPAPVAPTEFLVASGLYRHTRNPMYVGVLSVIEGQALAFGSTALLAYGLLMWVVFHTFVILYEEPTLRRQFGKSYERYRANVPRWWPRATAWPAPRGATPRCE